MRWIVIAYLLLVISSLSGCGPTSSPATFAQPMQTRTETPQQAFTQETNPIPTLLHSLDTGWQALRPGLERRVISIHDAQNAWVESLYILRLNPSDFRFDVAYDPNGKLLENWELETDALILVNGGYFREENGKYIPNGLTIVNGKAMGTSYFGYGGMFAVTADGPEVRWLLQQPYQPGEYLLAGLQSFPMLVKPGGQIGFPPEKEDYQQARRTVVAQDRSGHILFMIANQGYFTLYQLSAYLSSSDLNLDTALNLDGGLSSGLLLSEPREEIPAYNYLPVVIAVYPR